MALNFPTSPVDKQIYIYASTGAQYVYDAANTRWTTNTFISNVVSAFYGSVYDTTNVAYGEANVVYASINSNWTVTNTVYSVANSAYGAANNVGPQIAPTYNTANASFIHANSSYALANVNYGYSHSIANGSVTINNISLSGTINPGTVHVANQVLTDGTTINWDIASGPVATVTLGGNRTIAAPSNLKVGTYILHVIQDGTGGHTLTWNSVFKWPAGIAPTLTTTANRHDLFSFVCDGTNLYGSYIPDVR